MKVRHQQLRQDARTASRYAYEALREDFFLIVHRKGTIDLPFSRDDRAVNSKRWRGEIPGNRRHAGKRDSCLWAMPEAIARTQPPGKEWVIERRGKSDFCIPSAPHRSNPPQSPNGGDQDPRCDAGNRSGIRALGRTSPVGESPIQQASRYIPWRCGLFTSEPSS